MYYWKRYLFFSSCCPLWWLKVEQGVERLHKSWLGSWAITQMLSSIQLLLNKDARNDTFSNNKSILPNALCADSKAEQEVHRLLRRWAISQKLTENKHFFRSWAEVEQRHIWQDNSPMWKGTLQMHKALCKCTRHFANALAPICYWRRCLFGKIDAELIWYWKECLFLLIQEVSFLVSFLLGTRSVFWIGNKTYPIGNKTYLIWNKTYPIGNKTYLIGNKTYPIGNKTYLIWNKTYPIGNKTYLIGNKTYPIWNKTYLIGNRTYPIGNKTYLIGNRTYQFRTRDGSSIGKKRVWNWKIASFVLEKVWSVLLSRRKRLLDLLWGGHD